MNHLQSFSVCAIAWSACCLSNPALPAAEAEPVTTSASSGEYQTLWLQLEHGGVAFDGKANNRFDVPLFIGLRDGTAVVAWFVHPALSGGRVVWLDAASLSLRGEKLSGNLAGRTNLHWGDKNVRDYQYTLDASISDGRQIAGKFSAHYVDDAGEKIEFTGKLSGKIVTDEQAAADKLPADRNWPHYYGDGFQFAGPACGAKLIDDLAQALPVATTTRSRASPWPLIQFPVRFCGKQRFHT